MVLYPRLPQRESVNFPAFSPLLLKGLCDTNTRLDALLFESSERQIEYDTGRDSKAEQQIYLLRDIKLTLIVPGKRWAQDLATTATVLSIAKDNPPYQNGQK